MVISLIPDFWPMREMTDKAFKGLEKEVSLLEALKGLEKEVS